jgi:hypothetical protein
VKQRFKGPRCDLQQSDFWGQPHWWPPSKAWNS